MCRKYDEIIKKDEEYNEKFRKFNKGKRHY